MRVFLVTGSNKGIGKSIVKLLLQHEEKKIVYLTSRNPDLGTKSAQELAAQGFDAKYHQLDITDRNSIQVLRDYLVKEHGGLDVLVNNAGIAYKSASTAPFSEQAKVTNRCNFFGTLDVCEILFPILRDNARVVNVSSMASERAFVRLSEEWKKKFSNPELTMDTLRSHINEFIAAAREGKVEERGFPKTAYGMSKVGVTFMSILQQKSMDLQGRGVIVNACCPGYVNTDMTSGHGHLTTDEGADTPTYLALLDNETSIKGCFVKLRKVVPYPPKAVAPSKCPV